MFNSLPAARRHGRKPILPKAICVSVPRSGTIAREKNNYEALCAEYINSVAAGWGQPPLRLTNLCLEMSSNDTI